MLEGIDASEKPIYDISEVAKVFFARSTSWVRWADRQGHFILDGEYVGGYRHNGKPSGERRYTLAHIEKMAHALGSNKVINHVQLRQALVMVKLQAEMYGYLQGGRL